MQMTPPGDKRHRFDCLPYRERRVKLIHKECLFSYFIKRSRKVDFETTFDCKIKFDVHRNGVAVDNPIYMEHAPLDSDSGLDSIRILLIITLQWETRPEHKLYSCCYHSGARYQSFFVSSNTGSFAEVVDRLKEIISPLLSSLGPILHEENHAVTNQLLRFVTLLYSQAKDLNQLRNSWFPIAMDIAVEVDEPENLVVTLINWPLKEAQRFLMGLEFVMRKRDTTNHIVDACSGIIDKGMWCSICQDSGPPECEYVRLPSCSHSYHEHCITWWLAVKRICPLCRAPLRTPEGYQWRKLEESSPRTLSLFSF